MRQSTLGSELRDFYELDLNRWCRVEAQATGDLNSPTWATVKVRQELLILPMSARERVTRADWYQQTVTHSAYCEGDNTYLKIGYRLVEVRRKDEQGRWLLTPAAEVTTWEILGKEKVPGLPEPFDQVRLDLAQVSPVN